MIGSIIVAAALCGQAQAERPASSLSAAARPVAPEAGSIDDPSVWILHREDSPRRRVYTDPVIVAEMGRRGEKADFKGMLAYEESEARAGRAFWVYIPCKVRMLSETDLPGSAPGKPRTCCRIEVLEGPQEGKVGYVFGYHLLRPDPSVKGLLDMPYGERTRQYAEHLKYEREKAREDGRNSHRSLADKRRSRKDAAYAARLRREAEEERAMARAREQARKDYMTALPYMLEARRQDMELQAARERAAATRAIADSIRRAAGYSSGTYVPPRVVNDTAGIYNGP